MSKIWPPFLFVLLGLMACYPRPDLSEIPKIDLNYFYFKETDNLLDSLVIALKFEDGDGNLGLDANNTAPPYHIYSYFVIDGDTLSLGDNDTLPEYNCIDYEIIKNDSKVDTIYVQRNKNHYNFFLDFMIKEDGKYRVYVPAIDNNCAPPYHGRFFILNTEGDERPIRGTLFYRLTSGFRLLFRNDSLKMRLQIQDTDLNKSNIIETDPFMINDIIKPA